MDKNRLRISAVFVLILLLATCCTLYVLAQDSGDNNGPAFPTPDPNQAVGLTQTSEDVSDGYILMSIIQSKEALLLSNDGRIVHKWDNADYLGQSVYLLPNGHLLRTVSLPNAFGPSGQFGYVNGRLEEDTWDGEVVWSYELATDTLVGHHDIEPMPNGHILMVYFEKYTPEQAVAAGRNPALISAENQLWGEAIFELDPATNQIVWEWHVWDHVIQDYDPAMANYGVVADHPERINVNYLDPEETPNADWLHVNAIDYNADLDQIILSPRTYSEIWVIDHHTTTEEAKGAAGDLLFRWGNPATYNTGAPEDRPLYFQHDPNWIPDGYPGAGHILIFDNGSNQRPYSRVVEIKLPTDDTGAYIMKPDEPTTADVVWEYRADPPEDFYSALISSAQRQPNGNTLITEGLKGRIFEVTPDGKTVWEYLMPPGTWVFRSERYDLSALNVDLSGDLGFAGGMVWNTTCQDGTQPYLYEYQITDNATLRGYMDKYGDDAQTQWAAEVCTDHGGVG